MFRPVVSHSCRILEIQERKARQPLQTYQAGTRDPRFLNGQLLEPFDSRHVDQAGVSYPVPADPKLSEARVTCELGQPIRRAAAVSQNQDTQAFQAG